MFGKRRKASAADETKLTEAVRSAMPGADPTTVNIVTAIVGLLGQVAYADRDYCEDEEANIRAELARVQGLSPHGIDAICAVLREHILQIASVESAWYSRLLREECDRDFRIEILQTLVDLAAADGSVSLDETNLLRQTARALGLSDVEYNQAQRRHQDKLSVLRS